MNAHNFPPIEAASDGFSYHATKGLLFKNIAPAPISELRLLFRKHPAHHRVRVATKAWVTAQLRLYDIPFMASDKIDLLKSTLEVAVKSGKCNKLPASTVAEERFLRKQLEDQLQQQHNQTFASLTSPSDQARFDFDLFLAKYFLDHLGRPAPQKQPEALVLQNFSYDTYEFTSLVLAVPGLGIRATNQPDLAVIGWQGSPLEKGLDDTFATLSDPDFGLHTPTFEANFDTDRFMAKYFLSGLRGRPEKHKTPQPVELYPFLNESAIVAIIDAAHSIPGLRVAQTASNGHSVVGWEPELTAFVQQVEAAAAEAAEEERLQQEAQEKAEYEEKMASHMEYAQRRLPPSGPLRMEHLVGSYRVECSVFEEDSTLDIHASTSTLGATAAFNFGIFEGTMLMALSKDALKQLREEKGDDDGWPGSSRPSVQRTRDETPHPNRVYLQWRGRETGEGVIEVDYSNQHLGYFDFKNGGLTARGRLYHPFGDPKQAIELYKIDDHPHCRVEPWSNFTEEQYEYERVARWRR